MKLLFVVTEDWYFVSHRLSLAVAAKKSGFDVAVATRASDDSDTIRNAGIRLIPFNLSRRHGNPLRELSALIRLYYRERPDIVHHVALKPIVYGSLSAKIAGVPAQVNAVAGLGWLFSTESGLMRMVRPAVRKILTWLLNAKGTLTIVQNPEDRALLARYLPQTRLRLIRGAGVNPASYTPASPPSGPVRIVLAARMLWDKGVGDFVEAARILTEEGICARFVLVGDPDPGNPASIPVEVLRTWDGANGIEWWGRRSDMPAVFQSAHIACLPSAYKEGLPKVLLEAAACGLPMVTTDAPGCREVVRHGENGLLVPVHDVDALARALRRLIQEPELRAAMGRRGREIVLEEFSEDRIIAETLAVYHELTL